MNDQVRDVLGELVATQGPALSGLPLMCKLLLNQHCPDDPVETEALLAAVNHDVVRPLLRKIPETVWPERTNPLVEQLVHEANISEEAARWAIDSWYLALHPPPVEGEAPGPRRGRPQPPRRQRSEGEIDKHMLAALGAAALGGGLPYFVLGQLPPSVAFVFGHSLVSLVGSVLGTWIGWIFLGPIPGGKGYRGQGVFWKIVVCLFIVTWFCNMASGIDTMAYEKVLLQNVQAVPTGFELGRAFVFGLAGGGVGIFIGRLLGDNFI